MKLFHLFICIMLTLTMSACENNFCSLNCSTPKQSTPYFDPEKLDSLTSQGILWMPKGDYIKIVIPNDGFFRVNSLALKEDKKPALKTIADLIKGYGSVSVKIVGYSDSIGDKAYNQKLSLQRAQAVLAYFWVQGLDPEHLYAAGLGSENPVADSNYMVPNSANRRTEIIIHAHCTTCF